MNAQLIELKRHFEKKGAEVSLYDDREGFMVFLDDDGIGIPCSPMLFF